jgi:hypothetical protein
VDAETRDLSHSLVFELAGSVGFRNSPLVQELAWMLFRPVTDRLARIGVKFDRDVVQFGFSTAMGNALPAFIHKVTPRGQAEIPRSGPLLIFSNHPGTYDSLIIASTLQRDDLQIISGDIPFLKNMPHAHRHFIFLVEDAVSGSTVTARRAIRHLQSGGAVLVYGYGHIDPDPAVYNDADSTIDQWSSSVDLFLKLVPQTKLVLSITSNVVSPKWRNSILYHLRRNPIDRRRLVEFGQVMTQLLFPGTFRQSPYISFDRPVELKTLKRESSGERILPAVIVRARTLLEDHMRWVKADMAGIPGMNTST